MNRNLVDLQNIKKEFDGEPVLKGISLSIQNREFVTLLGPSGCGKTTTLRIGFPGDSPLRGVVESIVFKGVHYEMMIRTEHFTFMVHSTQAEPAGKTVGLSVVPFDIHIMHKSAEAGH